MQQKQQKPLNRGQATTGPSLSQNRAAAVAATKGRDAIAALDKSLAESEQLAAQHAIKQQRRRQMRICCCGNPSCREGPFTITIDVEA